MLVMERYRLCMSSFVPVAIYAHLYPNTASAKAVEILNS